MSNFPIDILVWLFALVAIGLLVVRVGAELSRDKWVLAAVVLGFPAIGSILGMAIKGYPLTKAILIVGVVSAAMTVGTAGHPARLIEHFAGSSRKMSSKEQTGLMLALVLGGLIAAFLAVWLWPPV